MAQKKNSLVANINRRKRAGTSRSKSKSTVSKKSYKNMERGWGKTARKKKSTGATSTRKRTTPARKKSSGSRAKKS